MSSKEKIQHEEFLDVESKLRKNLILHNDDVHSFDYVIKSLVDICKHDVLQAEQCTFIVHYKGKCDVKKGEFETLKPMKEGLVERGLNATID